MPSDCCSTTVKLVLPPAETLGLETPITDGLKLAPGGLPICTLVTDDPETTWTAAVPVLPAAFAVTVIDRNEPSPAVDRVAVAAPLVSVVAAVTATPPDVAVKVTGTPAMRLLVESLTRAVITAVVEPSDKMLGVLVVTVTTATVGLTEPPEEEPLDEPPEDEPPLEEPDPDPVMVCEPPPQAANSVAARQAKNRNLRMSFILARRWSAFAISKDLILHAEFSA